ncbi:hypothetical protein AA0616_2064 [Komagataeibacter nataicola NRIC 0616]|nr:hypothetical protein AA0616_2064 [Komagataeibacter nataicola NRIC 0616]
MFSPPKGWRRAQAAMADAARVVRTGKVGKAAKAGAIMVAAAIVAARATGCSIMARCACWCSA